MPKIPIHRDNHCGRRCPALDMMGLEVELARIDRRGKEMLRVFSMLSADQDRGVHDRAKKDVETMLESGEIKPGYIGMAGNPCYEIALIYKYACELLNIEPKTWSTL